MPNESRVTTHYSQDGLLETIQAGIAKLGKTEQSVSVDVLAPVDEFHIGGRIATEHFLDQLGLVEGERVADIGCGLGGASRFAAQRYGCHVTGLDLTAEYVQVGQQLCQWVGLADQVRLHQGDASATSFPDHQFDKAYMLHVGMNIADKPALAAEMHRILKPGGRWGIYDIMQVAPGDIGYPVPWASAASESALASPDGYKRALELAGFRVVSEHSRRDFALEFLARVQATAAAASAPPPLGLHILMGATAPTKLQNMAQGIVDGYIAPIEIVAEAAG